MVHLGEAISSGREPACADVYDSTLVKDDLHANGRSSMEETHKRRLGTTNGWECMKTERLGKTAWMSTDSGCM